MEINFIYLILLFQVLAMATISASMQYYSDTDIPTVSYFIWRPRIACRSGNVVGDCKREEEEMMTNSEISQRMLSQGSQYISYGAMSKDSVPCDYRGVSYYNCGSSGQANPYSRGCSVITHCARA